MDNGPQEAKKNRIVSQPKEERIPFIDLLLINIPVLLFLALASLALALAFRFRLPFAIGLFVVAWWSLCGAFMLGRDFLKRKRCLYLRLRSPAPPEPGAALARSLMRTLCGMAVYAAALRYSRTNRT
jgi:hypothetical protein